MTALTGVWRPVGAQPGEAPFTELEIRPDGQLRFVLRQGSQTDAFVLEYRVEGAELVTRGEGVPESRTAWALDPDGTLTLTVQGHAGRYLRTAGAPGR